MSFSTLDFLYDQKIRDRQIKKGIDEWKRALYTGCTL